MRELPQPYIMNAIDVFRRRNGKVIVEIGSMRTPMQHKLHDWTHDCCNDGHSSIIFASLQTTFWSVDADPEATFACSRELLRHGYGDCFVVNAGGIQFLRDFPGKIDLLYLDGWDLELPQSASEHLRAYNMAKDKLHKNSVLLIDDTDRPDLGKARDVVPQAIVDGWRVMQHGRQILMVGN